MWNRHSNLKYKVDFNSANKLDKSYFFPWSNVNSEKPKKIGDSIRIWSRFVRVERPNLGTTDRIIT